MRALKETSCCLHPVRVTVIVDYLALLFQFDFWLFSCVM
jgi:hypothetical protein